ncbi:MAG: hydroxyacylglutathione hydrolase [Gammaproteobacteria bacterium]|jgi:hydroxyacylglutathione hydrolase|nr:hydroxyacylglutathione hydrolase [Gammaproteobacteria bacterium]
MADILTMFKEIHPIAAFSDNYIWAISDQASDGVCVVDPGDATPVIEYLAQNKLTLTDILITHHHPDHTGGLKELNAKFSPQVYGPQPSNIVGISTYVHDGDCVVLFGHRLSVIEVPGHTLDHVAFYCDEPDPPILFCGDTLFAAGCGRIFEGAPDVMHESLAKLAALQPTTAVYCTHEYTMTNLKFAIAADPDNKTLQSRISEEQDKRAAGLPTLPSSVQLELETNPFLRCNQSALQQSAKSQLGHTASDEIEVFAALRNWKDNF